MFSFFKQTEDSELANKNSYDFSFKSIDGEDMPLKQFQGKVILIVNTASKCGFTKQYGGLEVLHQSYKDKGLVVIAVPSNDFGGQEPGSNQEISQFCSVDCKVTFPVTEKTIVSGDDAHQFYTWAKQVLGFGTAPKWNFHKYLINRQGELIDYFHSTTAPSSQRLIKAVDDALSAT